MEGKSKCEKLSHIGQVNYTTPNLYMCEVVRTKLLKHGIARRPSLKLRNDSLNTEGIWPNLNVHLMSPIKDETRVMQCSGREVSVSKATLVIRMSTVSNRLHGSGKPIGPTKTQWRSPDRCRPHLSSRAWGYPEN